MALKAVHVSDVPNLDHVPDNASLSLYSSRFSKGNYLFSLFFLVLFFFFSRRFRVLIDDIAGVDIGRSTSFKEPKFLLIGHRGNGMNMLQSSDLRMKAVKENTILSFNTAGKYPVDFIEFDVQGTIFEKRVTELSLSEFLSYGPQREPGLEGKTLLRKTKDGKIVNWTVESDDTACTLQEAFQKVIPSLGFNIELKFDDHIVYTQEYLIHVLQAILQVYFLTNGGNEIYYDVRRNSLEEAIKVCLEGGLQGIVSEVRGIFRNPGAVNKIKELKLSLLTYGKLNNVAEAVYMQHLMGVDGVIVDFVQEITEAVSKMLKPSSSGADVENEILLEGEEQVKGEGSKPQFSQRELAFLLKLIPELIQQ
ncbi:hypothetical protein DH2020_009602 [Rehmannia glutinosa]|uniref:glycerophosphodiester phosphodiesterase n=1 Tax=Rehmannia glutinosa TaxID=99300 RepID=A0ABR0X9F2_REHGL